MNIREQIEKICTERGITIENISTKEICGCLGFWEPDYNRILISDACPNKLRDQVLVHEFVHSLDPTCRTAPKDLRDECEAEARAEFGAKLIVGDKYIDDGFLDNVTGGDLDLTLNAVADAEKLLSGILL